MATIGLIGAGHIGSQLARLAVANGYDVVISNSRGPETLVRPREGARAEGARRRPPLEAAKAGDIVVVTVPLKNYRQVPVEPLAGKIVIDTNNYYPERDGHIPELDNESTTTSELLQAHLPTSKVVKAFNHIYAAALTTDGQPAGLEESPRPGDRRRRPGGQGDRHAADRPVRLRHRRCRPAQRGVADPARHARLRAAPHGGRAAAGPRRGQALRRSLTSRTFVRVKRRCVCAALAIHRGGCRKLAPLDERVGEAMRIGRENVAWMRGRAAWQPMSVAGASSGPPASPGRTGRRSALAGNATLTAVASRSLERSRRFVAECQADRPLPSAPAALGSYDELLAATDVDAVYLPLPTGRPQGVGRSGPPRRASTCSSRNRSASPPPTCARCSPPAGATACSSWTA